MQKKLYMNVILREIKYQTDIHATYRKLVKTMFTVSGDGMTVHSDCPAPNSRARMDSKARCQHTTATSKWAWHRLEARKSLSNLTWVVNMSDIVKGHVAPGYERIKEIYQQVRETQTKLFIAFLLFNIKLYLLYVGCFCSFSHTQAWYQHLLYHSDSITLKLQDFARGSDASSQLCVYVRGEKVVDLWGSHGPKGDPNYGPDSLQVGGQLKSAAFFWPNSLH